MNLSESRGRDSVVVHSKGANAVQLEISGFVVNKLLKSRAQTILPEQAVL